MFITFEKGRRRVRRGEEEHAKRRSDGEGHGGVEGLHVSTSGVACLSKMHQKLYKVKIRKANHLSINRVDLSTS